MKILIPVTLFGRQGGFRVLSKLADEFIRNGHEVAFLTSVYSSPPYFPTVAEVLKVDPSGRLQDSYQPREAGILVTLRCLYQGLRALRRQNACDMVIVTQPLVIYAAVLAGLRSKTVHYIQAYEPDFTMHLPGIRARVLEFFIKRSYRLDTLKVVNAPLYLNYREIHAGTVVLPGLDFKLFYPAAGKQSSPGLRLGTIGRIEPLKGTAYVLEAFRLLRRERQDAVLVVAFGDRDAHCPEEGIFVVHPDGDANLADYYRSLDIYICAATMQLHSVHYPVIEAMACGIPVITTPYCPADDTNAWLIPEKEVAAIVERVGEICSDTELAREKCARALKDVQKFDWQISGKTMLEAMQHPDVR